MLVFMSDTSDFDDDAAEIDAAEGIQADIDADDVETGAGYVDDAYDFDDADDAFEEDDADDTYDAGTVFGTDADVDAPDTDGQGVKEVKKVADDVSQVAASQVDVVVQSDDGDVRKAVPADSPATTNAAAGASPSETGSGSSDQSAGPDSQSKDGVFESLSASYERLRHSSDSEELSRSAHEPLPDRSDQAAFSRETALLEAVAGNEHTPLEDRIFLARTMPFPNILVKLSEDPDVTVRKAVAENADDKNWLVGRLAKDEDGSVREAALHNPQASWKVRLEGAEDPRTSPETLDFLSRMGIESDLKAPTILATMVRRAVALNSHAAQPTLARLASDPATDVSHAAEQRTK